MATVFPDNSPHWHSSHRPAETQDNEAQGLGQLLKQARERRGLSLRDVSNETKIPVRLLDALERENLTAVSDPFYRRAEVCAYARAVHLDPDVALAALERALTVTAEPEVRQTGGVHLPTLAGGHVLIVVGIIIAGALAGWALWPRKSEVAPPNSTGHAGDGLGIDAVDAPQGRPTPSTPPPDSIIGTSLKAASDPAAQGPAATSAARMVETSPSAGPLTPSIGEPPATNDASRGTAVKGTELVIATEPAGARVTVNGIGWGTAPITIRHLPPGVKRIRVSKDGYVSEDRLVNLRENQSSALNLRLRNTP